MTNSIPKFLLVAGLCWLAQPAVARADDVQKQIFQHYLARAEEGEPQAQFIVGQRFENGRGTEKNQERANFWYGKAASKGHELAKWKLEQNLEHEAKPSTPEAPPATAAETKAPAPARVAAVEKPAKKPEVEPVRANRKETPAANRRAAPAAEPAPDTRQPELVARAAEPPKTAEPTPVATPEKTLSPKDIVLNGQWQNGRGPAEFLPSATTTCLPASAREVVCFSSELTRQQQDAVLTYTVKTVLSEFAKDGSFRMNFFYYVADIGKGGTAEKVTPGLEVEPRLGWQEKGRLIACKATSERAIQCETDSKVALNFSRM